MITPAATAVVRFGRFELLTHERRLLMDGATTSLGGRAIDLLLALAQRPGQLVGKHALMDLVWPGLVVQENNLAAQVSALRKVLGGDVIATIPGRGYRFIAHIESAAGAAHQAQAAAPAAAGLERDTMPPRQQPRTNLPVELPPLLGRADELAAANALLERHRLVCIAGAGGVGKSLLAQHLLNANRGVDAHGVCWVELAPVTSAAALPGAVAAAIGVHLGQGESLSALASAMAALTMLVALDNAEHLLADTAHLCQVLHDAAPNLRLVVTSQAPLKLAAERVFRLGPLAVPDAALPAAAALQFGAVALFVERAQALDGSFRLTESNAAAVTSVCRALDGLPLAIELAAARAPVLGMPRLLASMQDRLRLLTTSRNRHAPQRQQTLRATLEWSHALLSEREQQVFRRLGVIAGSAGLGFIQQVVADVDDANGDDADDDDGDNGVERGALDRWAVLDALDALVDRSLVTVLTTADSSGEPRYRLLESPRAYAVERLDAAGERARLQRRHALAAAAMFDRAYDEYFSGRIGVEDWLRRCEPDFDNARDAMQWARGAGDAGVQLRIGATLLRALYHSQHAQLMELAGAVEACIDPGLPEPLQLRAWVELSCVLADPQKQRSREAAEHALQLARRLDPAQPDRFVLYHALSRAASAAAQTDDLEAARALLAEARALADPAWPAQRVLWDAEAAQWIARMSGDAHAAMVLGRRLLALDLERGSDAAVAAGNLIDTELAAGDARGAVRSGTALVESLHGTRHEYSLAFARINLLAALLALDDLAQARPVARAAWDKAPGFDLHHATTSYLALLAALDARPHDAARLVGYSEAAYAARAEVREANETAAAERAGTIARQALGDAEFDRLYDEGAATGLTRIGAIAFGDED